MTNKTVRLGLAAAIAGVVMGCGGEPAQEAPVKTGSLEMPLQSTGSQGGLFRLAGTFALDDAEQTAVTVDELDPSETLTLTPQVGNYQLSLCDGSPANPLCQSTPSWRLFEVECTDNVGGQSAPPQLCQDDPASFSESQTLLSGVQLQSANPQAVSILLNQTTYASFQFYVPGQGTVTFARGTLSIDINVGEGYPDGDPCTTAVECASNVCLDDDNDTIATCQPATCTDGVLNGGEAGPDCGGPCSTACPGTCTADADCPVGDVCAGAQCVPGGSSCSSGSGCPAGTVCDPASNQCVSDCFGVICPPGEVCDSAGGGCFPGGDICPDGTTCPSGTICDPSTSQCLVDCFGVICPPGEVCGTAATGCVPGSGGGAACGNGLVEAGEQCDDGNTLSGDGCDACAYEACAGTGNCPVGYSCDTSFVCVPGCTSDTQCPSGVCTATGTCL